MCRDADERVLAAGIDRQELHPLAGVLPVQFDLGRDVEVGQRTLGVDEHDDEGFLVLEAVERARPAVDVLQAEVGDHRADRGGSDLRVRRGGEPGCGGHEECEYLQHDTFLPGMAMVKRAATAPERRARDPAIIPDQA